MDNLTHSLVGLAASKAGLERLSPAATSLCILAANGPDVDIVSVFFGDQWTYLHHHRGITHSIVGTLTLALLLPLVFHGVDRLIAQIRKRAPKTKLRGLILASLIVSASHPLMDWTNNYGIRPLLPWNSKWFYGDLVFIVDPFIWFFIGGAAFLLTANAKWKIAIWLVIAAAITFIIFFAVSSRPGIGSITWIRVLWIIEVSVLLILFSLKIAKRWREKIAIVAFAILVFYWGSLALIHRQAFKEAELRALVIAQTYGESVVDIAAMPTLANPFHWQAVVETDRAAYRFEMFLIGATGGEDLVRHVRPDAVNSPVVNLALNTRPARVFLDFARFPVVRVPGEDCTSQVLVQLADLRYTEPGNQRGTFGLTIPVECPTDMPRAAP